MWIAIGVRVLYPGDSFFGDRTVTIVDVSPDTLDVIDEVEVRIDVRVIILGVACGKMIVPLSLEDG